MLDVCLHVGIDGISVAGNRRTEEPRLGTGRGSFSGKPTLPDTLRITRDMAQRSPGKLCLRVSGGVFTGRDALEVLNAGADTVEFYTAFVYRGWNAASMIARELDAGMASSGASYPSDRTTRSSATS